MCPTRSYPLRPAPLLVTPCARYAPVCRTASGCGRTRCKAKDVDYAQNDMQCAYSVFPKIGEAWRAGACRQILWNGPRYAGRVVPVRGFGILFPDRRNRNRSAMVGLVARPTGGRWHRSPPGAPPFRSERFGTKHYSLRIPRTHADSRDVHHGAGFRGVVLQPEARTPLASPRTKTCPCCMRPRTGVRGDPRIREGRRLTLYGRARFDPNGPRPRKIFIFLPPGGLTCGKVCYNDGREKAASGAAFSLFCAGKQWLGPKKTPAGTNGRRAPSASRAQSGARTAPAQDARAGGGAHAGYARKKGSGGGADGMEQNGTRRRERYAGTERQNFTQGMGNMTFHDRSRGPRSKT